MSRRNSNPTINPPQELSGVQSFFCWCSGANIDILRNFPHEYNKFFGVGTAVFMTGVFAFISSSFALSAIFRNKETGDVNWLMILLVASTWGFFIFFLDRYLVSSMTNTGSWWRSFFGTALPRIVLAVFISLVISRPLEIRIAQEEIMEFLEDEKQQKIQDIDEEYEAKILEEREDIGPRRAAKVISGRADYEEYQKKVAKLEEQIDTATAEIERALEAVECECRGICGTGKKGDGPACKDRRNRYNEVKRDAYANIKKWNTEIDTFKNRMSRIEKQSEDAVKEAYKKTDERVAELEAQKEIELNSVKIGFATSLIARNSALEELRKEDPGTDGMIWGLTLLFILLEITPVIVKLASKKGDYEDAVEDLSYHSKVESRQRRFLSRRELTVNKELIHKLANAQKKIIRSAIEEWEEHERDNIQDNYSNYINNNRQNNDDSFDD